MERTKSILVVSQSFFPAIGGVSSFLAALTYGLARLGHQVHALHFRVSDSGLSIPGVQQHEIDATTEFSTTILKQYAYFKEDLYRKLHGLDSRGIGDICAIRGYRAFQEVAAVFSQRASTLIEEHRVEILNVHDYQLFPVLATNQSVSRVLNLHTPILPAYPRGTMDFLRGIVATADQAVVSIPDYLTTLAGQSSQNVTLGSRLVCIPPFIDNALQVKLATMGGDREVVLPDSPFTVVCVQRFDSKSGHQQLIRGFADFLEETPEALLVLVGGPSFTDSITDVRYRYYHEARELTAALGIESNVLFMGSVPYQHIGAIYDRADVFCMLSKNECFGLGLTEAMMRRIPAIVTNVGGLGYQVRDGIDGITVEAGDHLAVTSALKLLRENPHLKVLYSESAYRRYMDLFNPNEIMRRYQALFQSL